MNMLKCQNSYRNYDSTRQVIRENLVSFISFLIEYHSILSTTHVIHVSFVAILTVHFADMSDLSWLAVKTDLS